MQAKLESLSLLVSFFFFYDSSLWSQRFFLSVVVKYASTTLKIWNTKNKNKLQNNKREEKESLRLVIVENEDENEDKDKNEDNHDHDNDSASNDEDALLIKFGWPSEELFWHSRTL